MPEGRDELQALTPTALHVHKHQQGNRILRNHVRLHKYKHKFVYLTGVFARLKKKNTTNSHLPQGPVAVSTKPFLTFVKI